VDAARVTEAEGIIGHHFSYPWLLFLALTHPSYAAEHADTSTYDRLEFLGDAVLGFVVSDHVYATHPHAREGELTTRKHYAVSGTALAEVAEHLGLGEFVLVGVGARAAGDRQRVSVLENTLEAVIGAIYLDAGLEAARAFVVRVLEKRLAGGPVPEVDAKGALQRLTQATTQSLPVYRIIEATGPIHQRTFTAEVTVAGTVVGRGSGATKQAAQKAAAAAALEALADSDDPSS